MIGYDNTFPHGIMFHHFHGGKHPLVQGSISAGEFSELIEGLGPERILAPQDWLARAADNKLEPHHICLTFDDALLCQYDIAKGVMDDYGMTAFWFVYSSVITGGVERLEIYRYFRSTNYPDIEAFYDEFFGAVKSRFSVVYQKGIAAFDPESYLQEFPFYSESDRKFRFVRDRILKDQKYFEVMDLMIENSGVQLDEIGKQLWLNESHLRELDAQRHCIGLHSFSHPTRMEDLTPQAQLSEYSKNFDHLHDLLGKKPQTMSHPCNSYSQDTLRILRDMGIQFGFRANMSPPTPDSILEWPREDHANIIANRSRAT